ncbi:MAG: outer membrane beta-barrel protein [Gemmatimonadaceae bacterium]|nr:outer membrane beta-barrel protein [Gemmatimonadaceae bacterium]
MLRRSATVILSLCAAVAASAPLSAQSAHRWSLQASGLYVGVYGDAYTGLSNGAGFEAQVRYNPSAFSLGVGYQSSVHDLNVQGFKTVDLSGPFVEPRFVLDIGSDRAAPYLAARVAYLTQQADITDLGDTYTLTANGTQINGGGGVLVRMTPRVNLDIGATFGAINFEDVVVTNSAGATVTVNGSSGSGKNLVLRFGVSIGLGK